jgi:hypothetical protein
MAVKSFKILSIYLLLFLFAFEGTMGSMKIAGISYPRIVESIIFIFLFKNYLDDISTNKVLNLINKVFGVLILLLALKLFTVTFLQDSLDMSIFIEAIRVVFLDIIIYLIYYVLINYKNTLQIILIVNSIIMLVAFFQSSLTPFTDIAWDLKNNYFSLNTVGYDDNITFRKRVTGFYSTSIPLAYVLTMNMIITVYLYLKNKSNIYIMYFVFLGVIAILSLTRSVVLSWVVLFLYISFIGLTKAKITNKILFIILLFFSFSYATNIYLNNMDSLDRVTNTNGASAQGRLPLAITGLYATVKYPFGISKENYKIVKEEMYEILHNKNILKYSSHNGVVNIGLKYTFFGLIIFILFLFYMIKLIKQNLPSEMKYFFIVAFFAYLANSLFHNTFIIIDDFYGIILFSIIAYEYKINYTKVNYA